MPLIIAIPFVFFFGAVIALFVLSDQLVKYEHRSARENWEADGCPPGFFWTGGGYSIRRQWARDKAMWRWLWSTPDWIRKDPAAQTIQSRMRVAFSIEVAFWVIAVVASILEQLSLYH